MRFSPFYLSLFARVCFVFCFEIFLNAESQEKTLMEHEVFIIDEFEYCRICKNSNGMYNISTESFEGQEVLLHEALEFVSCLKVDFEDGMSQYLCAGCSNRLLEAFNFKNQALEAYRSYCETAPNTSNKTNEVSSLEIGTSVVLIEECSFDDVPKGPALILEGENGIDIDLSTNAVAFLLEHEKCKNEKSEKNDNTSKPEEETEPGNKEEPDPITISEPDQIKQEPKSNTPIKPQPTTTETTSPVAKKDQRKPRIHKYKCSICERTFFQKSNLIDHLRMHTKQKNYVCEFCDKPFVQIANYNTHLRIHTKERPYKCHLCPKTYTQGSSLKTHIRSHTCEKNYICSVCDKGFTNSTDLSKHKAIHDLSLQFKCEFCERMFTQRGNLRIHQRNVHMKKEE